MLNITRKEGQNVFFMADSHFNHSNIVKGCSKWDNKNKCRDFATITEHDKHIIVNINNIVKKDDILFHLGDFALGSSNLIAWPRSQIQCQEIHLLLGNHDKEKATLPFFTSVNDYLRVQIDNQNLILCHYAFRSWHGMHRGYINLYGHSHDSMESNAYGKSMDVGVDSAYRILGEYRPFKYEEILEIMSQRDQIIVDSHKPKRDG